MAMNDNGWRGGKKDNDGPPDLDEIFRSLNQKLSRLLGGGQGNGPGGSQTKQQIERQDQQGDQQGQAQRRKRIRLHQRMPVRPEALFERLGWMSSYDIMEP